MRALTRGDASHCGFTASSPPTWMYSPGNTSMTSVRTSSRNLNVESSTLNRFSYTPQSDGTSLSLAAKGGTPNSGYATMAALAWPGISTSGTTLMCRAAAYFTMSRACSCAVSYTHLRAHETPEHLVCRLL